MLKSSRWDHRSTDDGMGERTGRVNWGPSAARWGDPQPDGIIHKPSGGRQRRRCGHSKRWADRTIQPDGEPRATGLVEGVRSSGPAECGIKAGSRPRPRQRPISRQHSAGEGGRSLNGFEAVLVMWPVKICGVLNWVPCCYLGWAISHAT